MQWAIDLYFISEEDVSNLPLPQRDCSMTCEMMSFHVENVA